MTIALSSAAYAGADKKGDFLLNFFDLNEKAYAYHRHCFGVDHQIDKNFSNTLDIVANELLAEAVSRSSQKDPSFIKDKILERRYNIQYELDHISYENGCNTPEVAIAKAHYEEFSRYKKSQILKLIEERGRAE